MTITKKEPRTQWFQTGVQLSILDTNGIEFTENSEVKPYYRDEDTAGDTDFGLIPRDTAKVLGDTPVGIAAYSYVLVDENGLVTDEAANSPKAQKVYLGTDVSAAWTIGDLVAANVEVSIFRQTEIVQDHDYLEGDKYFAENNEEVADQSTQAKQEIDYQVDRSLRYDIAYDPSAGDTKLPRPKADAFIKWNKDGDAFETGESFRVDTTPDDDTPATLREKIQDSASVEWDIVDNGTPPDDSDIVMSARAVNGAIDHDQLFNFVMTEHVDHANTDLIPGNAITIDGGSVPVDTTGDRTIAVDESAITHSNLTGSGGLNHEGIDIVAGDGLQGGGTIDQATVTLDVDPSAELLKSPAQDTDEILIDDGTVKKTTLFPSTLVAPAAIDTANDEMLFRDDSDGGRLKKAKVADIVGTATVDGDAIHDNVANEIQPIAPKASPVAADEFIIEDSETLPTAFEKKSLSFGDLESSLTVTSLNGYGVGTTNFLREDGTFAAPPGGYTDEQAQDAVGGILTDTATVDFTYNDAGNQITADVVDDSVDNTKAANMPALTIKGNNTGASADPIDLTGSQAVTVVVSESGGGTANFLRADGSWAAPAGGGGGGSAPVGTISPYGGTTAPTGWLLCDGSSHPVTSFTNLWDVIGNSFGGNGTNIPVYSGSFNVPDLRGQFIRGVDGGEGNDPDAAGRTASAAGGNTGDNVGSQQPDGLASHTHTYTGGGGTNLASSAGSTHSNQGGVTGATGGNETRPKNVYVNFIIKAQDISGDFASMGDRPIWKLTGNLGAYDFFDGYYMPNTSGTFAELRAATLNSGTSGTTQLRIHRERLGVDTTFGPFSLTSGTNQPELDVQIISVDYEPNDLIWMEIIQAASGSDELTVQFDIAQPPPPPAAIETFDFIVKQSTSIDTLNKALDSAASGQRIYVESHADIDGTTVLKQEIDLDNLYIEFGPGAIINRTATATIGLEISSNKTILVNANFSNWGNLPTTDRGLVLAAASKNTIVRGGRFDSNSNGGYDDSGTNNSVDVILEVP